MQVSFKVLVSLQSTNSPLDSLTNRGSEFIVDRQVWLLSSLALVNVLNTKSKECIGS